MPKPLADHHTRSGVLSSYVYRQVDRPRYFPGHGSVLGSLAIAWVLSAMLAVYYRRQNARKARELQARGSEWTADDKAAHQDEGDDAPFFVCTRLAFERFWRVLTLAHRHALR